MDSDVPSVGISVLKCKFIPEKLKCLKIKQHKKLFIAVWKGTDLVIYNNNDTDITDEAIFTKQKYVDKDDITFKFDIIDVFMTNHNIYVGDKCGNLHELHYSVHHVDNTKNRHSSDMEMFELSPGCLYGWNSTCNGVLDNCDSLVAISAVRNKIVAITKHSQMLLGQVYSIKLLQKLYVFKLFEDIVDKIVLSCCHLQFSKELKSQYFSFLDPDDKEIALVGLSSGQMLSFSLKKQLKPEVVFSSSESIISVEFNIDKVQQVCTAVLVLCASGQLTILNGKHSQSIYIPGPVHTALFNSVDSIFFTSDGVDSLLTKVKLDYPIQDRCTGTLVKGVRAMSIVPDIPSIVLASTVNGSIYWLDTSIVSSEESNEFMLPQEDVIKELLLTTKHLKDANIEVEQSNSVLRAISLATRAKFLDKYFTILVKFYSGKHSSDDKVKLRIESDCDFAPFTPDIWTLNTVISFGENSIKSFETKLEKTFSKELPLSVEINCSPIIESELSCKMIARINHNEKEQVLFVNLGKIVIDAGYFFNTVKDKMKFLKRVDELSLKTDAMYECKDSSSTAAIINHHYINDSKAVIYSVRVCDRLPIDSIISMVLRNSSHRMSKNQWMTLSKSSTNEVFLAIKDCFWVELSLDKCARILHIKSNDAFVCYSVKRAVSSRFGSDEPVVMDVDTYLDAEKIKYQYELARISEDWDLKKIHSIKHDFRARFS